MAGIGFPELDPETLLALFGEADIPPVSTVPTNAPQVRPVLRRRDYDPMGGIFRRAEAYGEQLRPRSKAELVLTYAQPLIQSLAAAFGQPAYRRGRSFWSSMLGQGGQTALSEVTRPRAIRQAALNQALKEAQVNAQVMQAMKPSYYEGRTQPAFDRQTNQTVFVTPEQIEASPERYAPIPKEPTERQPQFRDRVLPNGDTITEKWDAEKGFWVPTESLEGSPLPEAPPAHIAGPPEAAVRGIYIVPGPKPVGMLDPGNIDISQRPQVRNADGTISTVRSIGVNIGGKEVLIPTVSEEGRIMSDDDAVAEYRSTGRHLGVFDTPAHATSYAQALHREQEARGRRYSGPGRVLTVSAKGQVAKTKEEEKSRKPNYDQITLQDGSVVVADLNPDSPTFGQKKRTGLKAYTPPRPEKEADIRRELAGEAEAVASAFIGVAERELSEPERGDSAALVNKALALANADPDRNPDKAKARKMRQLLPAIRAAIKARLPVRSQEPEVNEFERLLTAPPPR